MRGYGFSIELAALRILRSLLPEIRVNLYIALKVIVNVTYTSSMLVLCEALELPRPRL